MPKGNCEFKGTGGQYFPTFFIHLFLITTVTFGIYMPWAWVRLLRLRASHTIINGKSVSFTGTGGQLLGIAIVQGLFTVVTLGLYGPWAVCKYFKWRAENTLVGGKASQFTGTGGSLFFFYLIHLFLLPAITFGIYLFWGVYRLYGWKEEHTRYGGETTSFGGAFGEFLKISLICWFLNLITFNLYTPWAFCKLYRWQTGGLAVGDGAGVDHFPPVKTKPMVVLIMILIGLLPWVFLMLVARPLLDSMLSPDGRSMVTGPPTRLSPKAPTGQEAKPRPPKDKQVKVPKGRKEERSEGVQKDSERARLDAIIQKEPRNAKALYNRAWIAAANGEMEQAEKDYNEAIQSSPTDSDAYFNRGLVYVRLNKWEEALEDFNETIRLDPLSADGFCNRGNVQFKMGRADLAMKDYTDGLRLAPNDGVMFYNRGLVYLSSGEEAKGQEDLRRAAELGVVQAMRLQEATPGEPPEAAATSEETAEGPGEETEPGVWRTDLTGVEIPEDSAEGRINGMSFTVDEAGIQSGVLSLRQGFDAQAEREFVIPLSLKLGESAEGKSYTVSRTTGSGAPRIQMKWLDEDTEEVKAETFSRDYAMRLELGSLEEGRLSGKIYLCLPDEAKSYVAGVFSAEIK